MQFKPIFHTILIGLALWICLGGVGQKPAIAAPLTATETMPAQAEPLGALALDRFLTSIPSGYYTIPNVEGLKRQLKDSQTVLVDVREFSEYQRGHIANAINIPLRTLAQNLDQIPADRPVVVYCSSGYRSAMGVMTLQLLGYDNVRGFPPSFAGWQGAGEAIAPSTKN
ncbi:MAG: rhodanese-like domain-containing protein [Spirulina sp. DLM2.Bin59]|nr:MAG: rhodanese-like domain-containing protein [Spirulina sp. DLM2.Bin59]